MSESVRVFAPATVANVSAAFDILGFALNQPGDEVIARLHETPGVTIHSIHGDNGKLPTDPRKNTASVAVQSMLDALPSAPGIEIELFKNMPLGSGLGSSAASAVAAVYACNQLLDAPFNKKELLPFVMTAEAAACGVGHADNVAPSLFGGFVLIRSYDPLDIIELPVPDDLFAVVVHPEIEIRTEDARKILRKEIRLADAVKQWGNIAGIIAALYRKDVGLLGRSLQDHIVEPVRSLLIPGFRDVQSAALQAGALGCSLSGSGPSIFSLCAGKETAQIVADAMNAAFANINITAVPYVSAINTVGPTILD